MGGREKKRRTKGFKGLLFVAIRKMGNFEGASLNKCFDSNDVAVIWMSHFY